MTTEAIELTPAQVAFLGKNIQGFQPHQWLVQSAGRAGSERHFYRVFQQSSPASYILIVWNSSDPDWDRFIKIERELRTVVDFLPRLQSYDEKHGLILEEDLGAMTLHAYCLSNPPAADIEERYRHVLDCLIKWQHISAASSPSIASREMGFTMLQWETGYFAEHCVTEYFGCERLLTAAWERERGALAEEVAALPKVCMHRDFQSENVLLQKERVRFVDFQGARLGPADYDAASLLCDPYVAALDEGMTGRLLEYYRTRSEQPQAARAFHLCAAQRLMQALGAYANLSIHKGKDWYRRCIPLAIDRLDGMVRGIDGFNSLRQIITECRGKLEGKGGQAMA
jgi:hypothetical protein